MSFNVNINIIVRFYDFDLVVVYSRDFNSVYVGMVKYSNYLGKGGVVVELNLKYFTVKFK